MSPARRDDADFAERKKDANPSDRGPDANRVSGHSSPGLFRRSGNQCGIPVSLGPADLAGPHQGLPVLVGDVRPLCQGETLPHLPLVAVDVAVSRGKGATTIQRAGAEI